MRFIVVSPLPERCNYRDQAFAQLSQAVLYLWGKNRVDDFGDQLMGFKFVELNI